MVDGVSPRLEGGHQGVAQTQNMDVVEVKVVHLSLLERFNKKMLQRDAPKKAINIFVYGHDAIPLFL